MNVSAISSVMHNVAALQLFAPLFNASQSSSSQSPCSSPAITHPHSAQRISSPLINAAFEAFEAYIGTQEAQNAALISSVATYALTPKGAAAPLSPSQMAPFYALNLLA